MSHATESTDSDWDALLAAARRGDDVALGQICEQVWGYLRLVADRELGDELRGKLDASDIVQQALLDAQQDLRDFRGSNEPQLRAWLVKLVRHNLVDEGRRYRNTQRRDLSREVSLDASIMPMEIAGSDRTASSIIRRRETDLELERAVAKLSARRQRLLQLRHLQGMSFAEIGHEFGISEVAARQLWARTVNELRKRLASCEHDRPGRPQ